MYELIIETKKEKIRRLIEELKELEKVLREYEDVKGFELKRIKTEIE